MGLWILTDVGMNSQPCHILARVSWACHLSQSLSFPSIKQRDHHWIPRLLWGFKIMHTSKYPAHSKRSIKCRTLLQILKYPLLFLFKHIFPRTENRMSYGNIIPLGLQILQYFPYLSLFFEQSVSQKTKKPKQKPHDNKILLKFCIFQWAQTKIP